MENIFILFYGICKALVTSLIWKTQSARNNATHDIAPALLISRETTTVNKTLNFK